MRKLLILFFVSMTSITAHAFEDQWHKSDLGGFFVLAKQSIHRMVINKTENGENGIWLKLINVPDACKILKGRTMQMGIMKINGTKVKMSGYCKGKHNYLMPTTNKGKTFMVNEFKRRNFVNIEILDMLKYNFSAKGFTKAWNTLASEQAAI